MKQRDETFPSVPSPLRLFLTVLVISFLAEAAVMFLLQVLRLEAHPLVASIADAAMMIVLAAPFLWWFLVRPLRRIAVAEHVRAATVVKHAVDGIITLNAQGLVESFNPAAERIFGYRAEEVAGKPLTLLMPERYRDAHRRGLEQARSGGASRLIGKTVEMHGLRKEGSEFPLELCLAPWGAGDQTYYTGIVRDITERKRTEQIRQALYEATREIQTSQRIEDRLARLLRTACDVLHLDRVNVLLADPDGQWLQAVAGLGTEEPLEAIRVPIGPEGGGLARAYQTQEAVVWDGRAPVPEVLRIRPPYDSIGAFRSRVFVIVPLVVQGRAIGVLGTDRRHSRQPFDPPTLNLLRLFASLAAPAIEQARLYEEKRLAAIQLEATVEKRTRELKEAMRQVEEASRHKSEFLANMSHELRTPLNAVIGFSELLLGPGVGPLTEKQARYLGHIHSSGKHLLQLISDILDLSKVEAGKITLEPAPLPVATTLEDILVIARGLANKKGQVLEVHIEPDLPPLHADPVRFKQVLFNLLSNAVKFTPEGGRITMTARRVTEDRRPELEPVPGPLSPVGWLEIGVTDAGVGIKAEDLPRLFQEFVQLETTRAQRHEGTGLGLVLTKRLVELHGGRIWAESEGEGHGSTFTVRLPLAPRG